MRGAPTYRLTPAQAATVRRLRAEGESWAYIALRLGWPENSIRRNVERALRRADGDAGKGARR